MTVFTYSQARQNLAPVLDRAKKEGKVLIKREDGSVFALCPETPNDSPLDIPGIKTKAPTEEMRSRRFHYSMPMEIALWEYFGHDKRHGLAGAFGSMKYFKKECRSILRKIKKRVNETVTNDELLLETLLHDIDGLDTEIKALSKSNQNEIDIIAELFLMIGHLLGWAYFEGKFFRTPIYFQTEQQRDDSLRKGERLKTPCEIPYQKRRFILQLRSEGVSYKEIAFILKVTEANVKSLEKAEHLDEWRENYLKRGSFF